MSNEQQIKKVSFAPGDILFRENETTYHFYIIQDGIVEVFKTGADGSRILLAEVGEGTSIGEFALIDKRPRSATAQAKTKVNVVAISAEGYEKLLNELPEWAVSVMRGLVERLRNANEIIRSAKTADAKTTHAIDSAEYNSDSSTVTDTSSIVDDTPDLA